MIRVAKQPKPKRFDELVADPGTKFLEVTPHPTQKQWKGHDYWNRVSDELHNSYKQICAYSCHWVPASGGRTCDHFIAKSVDPRKAYDWSNYRLCFSFLNGRKGTKAALDPFCVQDDWFEIRFPSLLVRPRIGLDAGRAAEVETTIKTFGLNDEVTCLKDRREWLKGYCLLHNNIEYLETKAPFLARELRRQGLVDSISNIMKFA